LSHNLVSNIRVVVTHSPCFIQDGNKG